MKRFFLILIGLIVILSLCGAGGYAYLKSTAPDYSGNLTVKAIHEPVEVLFDEFAVPHIYAENEEDAYYALGYVHASERLFQMEMIRRIAQGKLSEILGPDLLKTDMMFLTLGLHSHALESEKEFFSEINQPFQKAAIAYMNGLNEYIENGETPIEFQILGIEKAPFTVANLYDVAGYMAFGFAQGFKIEPVINKILKHHGPEYLEDFDVHHLPGTAQIPIHLPTDSSSSHTSPTMAAHVYKILESLPVPMWIGSNSWIVAPERSNSGKVIFANDPHIGFGQPSVWYEAHLETPDFSLYGNHLAGSPFAPIGHTRSHAIGLTMLENDDMQFYREKINPENPNQVWVNDHWEELSIRKETIKIKDGADTTINIKITRHGPIVNEVFKLLGEEEEAPISMHWIYTKFPSHQLHVSYKLAHGKNMQEVQDAVATLEGPGLNVMYGDTAGNIAWWGAGKLIKLPEHTNSKFILDGASGKDEPLGYFDFSENPQSVNPPSGYVYSANNQPGPVNGYLHPGYYAPGDRGQRVMNLIAEKEVWSKEEMKEMALDNTSVTYSNYVSHILPLIDSPENVSSEEKEQAVNLLKEWDGNHNLESVAPTIFYKWINRIMYHTMSDEIGQGDYLAFAGTFMVKRSTPLILANDSSVWWDDVSTSNKVESRTQIVNQAFSETISELKELLGKDINQWEWRRAHTLEHGHLIGRQEPMDKLFNVGPLPIAGGHEVINNTGFPVHPTGLYEVKMGPSRRAVIDFADLEHGETILPTGQSGNPMSPHYDDQTEMYSKGEYRTMLLNKEEILKAMRYKLTFTPE